MSVSYYCNEVILNDTGESVIPECECLILGESNDGALEGFIMTDDETVWWIIKAPALLVNTFKYAFAFAFVFPLSLYSKITFIIVSFW